MLNICTCFYVESRGEESHYYQNKGKSSDSTFQLVYWQCMVVMYATSFRFNPSAKHYLFINIPISDFPSINGVNIADWLTNRGVSIVRLDYSYRPPCDYFRAWNSVFFLFDAMRYFVSAKRQDDQYIFLDPDCVWLRSAVSIERSIQKYSLLGYEEVYPLEQSINGLSICDLNLISEEIFKSPNCTLLRYFGGEFYAMGYSGLCLVHHEFLNVWRMMLSRYKNGLKKFNTEEHFMTYIYNKLNMNNNEGNLYIRRMWTLYKHYEVLPSDMDLTVWHLPTEKGRGFKKISRQVLDPSSRFWRVPDEDLAAYLAPYFRVVFTPWTRLVFVFEKFLKYTVKYFLVFIKKNLSGG